ncbi:dipeptidase [Clostridium sp. MSJ-11]|uniref:Dipeptidase n=1 Tax=Clostridium mobile TaxID=2841512 RepID=A0ABS6EF45_9CLOT|nr:dipeptidase [Clostridium mobile]MBU5483825.1 dipeptidase [Clostridium mobile]
MNIIDLHCDTIYLLEQEKKGGNLYKNNFSVDIEKLKRGGSLAQFFALFIDKSECKDAKESCIKLMDRFYSEINQYSDHISLARNFQEMQENKDKGKISAFLTIEGGEALKGDMENLYYFFQNGVRLITLTWNYPNEIGFSSSKDEYVDKGLTFFGTDLIDEMNRLGMLIDVSHLSDRGFYEVADRTKIPFIASHSNAREIKPHRRNLTDTMIKVLSEKGGVMGINFYSDFLGDSHMGMVKDMVAHIKHIRNVGGIDCIALGSDFDGIGSPVEIEDISQMDKLIFALEKEGFSFDEMERILYKNAQRVIRDTLK